MDDKKEVVVTRDVSDTKLFCPHNGCGRILESGVPCLCEAVRTPGYTARIPNNGAAIEHKMSQAK